MKKLINKYIKAHKVIDSYCPLLLSADNLCEQFGPRSGQGIGQA